MLTGVAVAALVAGDVPWPVVALVGLALVRPWWAAAVLVALLAARLVDRPQHDDDPEAVLLLALAAELRAGAGWRSALGAAADRVGAEALPLARARARAGAPAAAVAAALRSELPHSGRAAAAALRLVATSGGPAADVFATLAAQAAARSAERRDRAAITAQARLSAALVGGAPVLLVGLLVATGRSGGLAGAGAAGAGLLAVGFALQALGIAVVVAMLRGAAR